MLPVSRLWRLRPTMPGQSGDYRWLPTRRMAVCLPRGQGCTVGLAGIADRKGCGSYSLGGSECR